LEAGLCPDRLGEFTALPQIPQLDLRALLLRGGEKRRRERGKGKRKRRKGGKGNRGGRSGEGRGNMHHWP